MKDLNEMYLDVLARDLAPMPWVLDQCNEKGVCVKDSRGEDLYFEDFTESFSIMKQNNL